MLQIVKYMKFSWKEQNNVTKSSLIGMLFDQETGYLKVRWLGGSALPVTEEVVSLLKYIVENDMGGRLKEKYIPCHFKIIERYGTSGCIDIYTINFPFRDGFEDFGYVSSKIHVSMYARFNEEVIYEGNIYKFVALLDFIIKRIIKDESFEDIVVRNLEQKEFTPWGESLRKIREKEIEKINEDNFEYEKF